MNFEKLREEINNLNIETQEELKNIVVNIDIRPENIDLWIDDIFSDKIDGLDFEKLPYLIEELYKSDDKFKFMLCCMLIESTCEYLPFLPNLEEYPLFKEKFKTLKHTLITVYEHVDNGIANCMALIILNNDPEFKMFNDDEKDNIANNTVRKLTDIINYIKNNEVIDDSVYRDLEIIIDLSIYLDDKKIDELIKELSKFNLNFECKLFIVKYKLINNLVVNSNEIAELLKSEFDALENFDNGSDDPSRNYSIKNYYILLEQAIEDGNNIILANDGIFGNIIFRTLVLLDKWPSYGAITLGIDEIFIDTSRDQSVEGYKRSLELAYKLAKLREWTLIF